MFEEFIGKKVRITICYDGEETTELGLKLISYEGVLIKVSDSLGNIRIINTSSIQFVDIQVLK